MTRESYGKYQNIKCLLCDDEKRDSEDRMRQSICHICEGVIKPGEKMVADHEHLTGVYRGKAHNRCNLNYRVQIPYFFHNLKHYDVHLLISAAKKSSD